MLTGFTCSCFDLLHAGHVLMLRECKQNCDFLIAALQTDPTFDREEKNSPIQTYFERYTQLEAIKYVDKIIPYATEQDLRAMLLSENIDVRFIGVDWKGKQYTGWDIDDIDIYHTKRYGYSTTELRGRISRWSI